MGKRGLLFSRKEKKKISHKSLNIIHQHQNIVKSGRHGKNPIGYIIQEGRGYK